LKIPELPKISLFPYIGGQQEKKWEKSGDAKSSINGFFRLRKWSKLSLSFVTRNSQLFCLLILKIFIFKTAESLAKC